MTGCIPSSLGKGQPRYNMFAIDR
uniref:Uncharacterized protein n=1 Tax=Rhizophora mucronata TaxID=61149 RepID=A0A2P2KFC1_RHIMU